MKYEDVAKQKMGEFLADALKERGMSINRLEKESSVSKTIIYKVLRGENYEINSLLRIMGKLQIHLEFSLMSADNNVLTMGDQKPSNN